MPFRSSGRGAYGPQGQRVLRGPLAPVWVTSGTITQATPGVAYSFQLNATDDSGVAPTYSLASGSLPTGLSIGSSGLISGTPSSSGTFTFTARATDENGRFTDSSTLTLVSVNPALYSFSSATFGNNGRTGQDGPNISEARSALGNPSWANTYLGMNVNGIQRWTVPETANYQFIVRGSRGGNASGRNGGQGAVVTSTQSLTSGHIIEIGVGQVGTIAADSQGSGGGGASWVNNASTGTLLLVAGGGGGSGNTEDGRPAQNTSTGGGGSYQGGLINNGGTGGNGGTQTVDGGAGGTCGVGGAGWFGDGPGSSQCGRGGQSAAIRLSSTARGGLGEAGTAIGGFGGGGGGANNNGYGGGGGGYAGGGSGGYPGGGGGGWGGSYFTGTNTSFTTHTGSGSVTVTKL